MDYRIFNVRMWIFCICIHTPRWDGGGGEEADLCFVSHRRTFLESAQNLTPNNLRTGAKPST